MTDIPDEIRERIEEEYRSGSMTALMLFNGNAHLQPPDGTKGVIEAQKDMIAHTWLESNELKKRGFPSASSMNASGCRRSSAADTPDSPERPAIDLMPVFAFAVAHEVTP